MRALFPVITAMVCLTRASVAGLPPRTSTADYTVQAHAGDATIAASIVPNNHVSRMFSPEIAKQYVVIELAIYPGTAAAFSIAASDFALQLGQRFAQADRPMDVAPWPENYPERHGAVDVTAETGVIYQHGNDPYYGRRNDVGTYSDVAVQAPAQPDPPPPPRVDPRLIYDRIQRFAIVEGATNTPIAGYLYFPAGRRKKSDQMTLRYGHGGVSANLVFPKH